jgi:hypothetical protein
MLTLFPKSTDGALQGGGEVQSSSDFFGFEPGLDAARRDLHDNEVANSCE